jgi:hypothetical protein
MLEHGVAVQPCHVEIRQSDGRKILSNLVEDWQSHGATRDQVLRAFANSGANAYLIACGPSGIVVADLDVKNGVDGIASWEGRPAGGVVVKTVSGGRHHYYRNDTGVGCPGSGLAGVDIKGIGGGVFGPGSLDGAYSVESWLPLTDWSGVGLELAAKRERKPLTYEPGWRPRDIFCDWSPSEAQRVLTDSLAEITDHIKTRGWNDSGFRKLLLRKTRFFGGFVGTGYLDESDAYNQLVDAIRTTGHEPDDDDVEIIESGLEVGAQDPVWVATKDPAPIDDLPKDPHVRSEMSTDDFTSMLIDAADLDEMPDPAPLIEHWLYQDTTARLVGQPGSYKSFVALDMACCVALGREWHGWQTTQTVVLYVVGEGLADYKRRVKAWCAANNVNQEELRGKLMLTRGTVQIGSTDWAGLASWVADAKSGFVVIDTQAKATAGYDENSNTDQAKIFTYLDALRQSCGGTLMLVHHTGHENGDAGERGRGASAWRASVDTEMMLTKTGERTASLVCDRQKIAESGHALAISMTRCVESLVVEALAGPRPRSARSQWIADQIKAGLRFGSANQLLKAVRDAGHRAGNSDKVTIFEEYHGAVAKIDEATQELADQGQSGFWPSIAEEIGGDPFS